MDQKEYSLFQNSAFPEINRSGISKKPKKNENVKNKKPYSGIGRDAKIDPDLFYRIKEENEQLKKTKLALNQKITKLETSLLNIKENVLKERRQADYKYTNPEKNYEIDFIKSKYENEKLKLENEKKDMIIKGLQRNYSPKDKNTQGKKRKIAKKKNDLTSQEVKNDYLALIARLREQLKMATEDKRNLIDEIKNIKEAYSNINLNMVNNNNYSNSNNIGFNNKRNQEIASKMADLNTNYESAQMKLDTQNKILEMTKRSLEEYKNKYERERDNCRKLETELALLKGQSDQIENYKRQLEDYKLNEVKLQEELNDLRISPFIKQAEERGNVYRNLQISQKKLAETKKNLDEKEKKLNEAELKLGSLEKENEQLKRSLNIEKIDKEKYKEESLKLKISRVEREKSDKLLQDKLNKYNQYGEIDSDFTNILSIYKRQNDDLNWANINFIEPDLLKNKNPDLLLKEIERLRLEKTSLGKELENAKNSLLIQQQINTEYKREKDYEQEKNKSEIKFLKNKIEELCKLIDIQNSSKENNNNLSQTNLTQTYKYPKTMPLVQKPNLLEEKLTEESQEETEVELTINENALDVYFGECIYEDDLEEKIGYNIDDMLSFFSVDFYMHETQTSDILSGKNPMFNFQILFKVDVNEGLLNYLKNEYMTIEVYSLRDEVQIILGEGKIGLNDLLNYNPNLSRQVLNGQCDIYYKKNKSLKIATLHYQMKMIKPLSEALKWYHEQNQINEEENSQLKESLKSKLGQSIKDYANIGKKVYEIKILVTKANDLIVDGPPRRISPYFYYKFYKSGTRYSKNCDGNNPKFEDSASFNEIITKEFLEYIQKENLIIYIFDSMNPIELDVNIPDEARLLYTNQQISKDLIGTCKIPLQGLLINDLIQGEFPIFNMKDEKVGTLIINIIWEEIVIGNDMNTGLKYGQEIYDDQLVIKLAEALKQKGLNIDSAFNIFDIDRMNEISIDNFKNTLIFTLKFTTNQIEIEHLIQIIYKNKGKTKLDKADFYKIFSKLLSNDGKGYMAQTNINIINDINNSIDNNNNNLNNKEKEDENTNIQPPKEKEVISSDNNNIPSSIINQSANNTEINNKENSIISNIKKDRSINELGQLILKFRLAKKSNYDAVDLFKDIFDKDASLGIDKKELQKGCEKMGIILTNGERDNLWKKISGNKGSIDFASFKSFYDNYCKKEIIGDSNNKEMIGENLTGTQMSGPFLTNKPE